MWIRSQDRMNLVEVKRLTAYEKQGKFRIINQVLYLGDISDDYDILGEYESKERAIEVLNEIQEKTFKYLEIMTGATAWVNPKYSPIYEMPEE